MGLLFYVVECVNRAGKIAKFWNSEFNNYIAELIKLLYKKHFGKPCFKTFPVDARSKTFLTSTTAVDIQQTSKIQSRLVVKPKIIQSLSAYKTHLINMLNSSNHLRDKTYFRIPWSKMSRPFFELNHPIMINIQLSYICTSTQKISSFLQLNFVIYIYIYIYI